MFTETTATSSSSSNNNNNNNSAAPHQVITITCEDPEGKQLPMDNSTLINTSTHDSEPPAYSQISVTAPPAARLPTQNPYAEMLPTYEHAKVDMPPSYPIPKYADTPFDAPIEPQEPWPLTKKLYIAGFVFWPLWFVGMGFCVFGREETTRLWGRRCAYNSLIVVAIFTYIIIAFFRTGGHVF